jgi:hypothetical protein
MAALTEGRVLEFVGNQDEISPRVAASDSYYLGGVLCFVSGYAAVPGDNANSEAAGVVTGEYGDGDRVDVKAVGAGETPRARLKRGKVWLPVSGAAQTDVGVIHYVADDQTMTKTAGSKTVGYRALDFKSGYLLFDLRQPDRIA